MELPRGFLDPSGTDIIWCIAYVETDKRLKKLENQLNQPIGDADAKAIVCRQVEQVFTNTINFKCEFPKPTSPWWRVLVNNYPIHYTLEDDVIKVKHSDVFRHDLSDPEVTVVVQWLEGVC